MLSRSPRGAACISQPRRARGTVCNTRTLEERWLRAPRLRGWGSPPPTACAAALRRDFPRRRSCSPVPFLPLRQSSYRGARSPRPGAGLPGVTPSARVRVRRPLRVGTVCRPTPRLLTRSLLGPVSHKRAFLQWPWSFHVAPKNFPVSIFPPDNPERSRVRKEPGRGARADGCWGSPCGTGLRAAPPPSQVCVWLGRDIRSDSARSDRGPGDTPPLSTPDAPRGASEIVIGAGPGPPRCRRLVGVGSAWASAFVTTSWVSPTEARAETVCQVADPTLPFWALPSVLLWGDFGQGGCWTVVLSSSSHDCGALPGLRLRPGYWRGDRAGPWERPAHAGVPSQALVPVSGFGPHLQKERGRHGPGYLAGQLPGRGATVGPDLGTAQRGHSHNVEGTVTGPRALPGVRGGLAAVPLWQDCRTPGRSSR